MTLREYGKVAIGKDCILDDDIVLGYPSSSTLKTEGWDHSLTTKIGPRCIIRKGCVIYVGSIIGSRVHFGHSVVVRENARIGEGSRIGSHTEIAPSVRMGRLCRIVGNSHIAYGTRIGNRVFIGPGLMTTNRFFSSNFFEGREDDDPNCPPIIEDNVLIGGQVTINPGIQIGEWSVIAAGCVVTKDVKSRTIVAGIPGKVIGRVTKNLGRGHF